MMHKKNLSVKTRAWHIAAAQKLLNYYYRLEIRQVLTNVSYLSEDQIEDRIIYTLRHSEDQMVTKLAEMIAETEQELKIRKPKNVRKNVAEKR